MSYIPYTYAPASAKDEKAFYMPLPSGGMSLEEGTLPDDKSAFISNLDILNGEISTRKAFVPLTESLQTDCQLHGITETPFNGKIIIHAGTKLYSCGMDDSEICETGISLPDEKSIFCTFMSKLYIYCSGRVFSLDNNFVITENMPDAPVIFENASPIACYGMEETYKVFNLLAPRISVTYSALSPQADYSSTKYILPRYADVSRPVNVFVNGVEVDSSLVTAEENKILIDAEVEIPSGAGVVKISYFVKDTEKLSYEDRLYGCNLSVAFGGNTNGGTRIILTGNEDYKGFYFKSGLQNPLYFGSDDYEVVGDGCENVTAVKKMYGNLLIFTEKSVFKMSHNITSSSVYYSIKEISNEIGCDCPGSVQLIDNRVVFANSSKGVFIVDSTDDTGEHNIKPISGNINNGKGMGLLECDADSIKSCHSIDFDRKYMLIVGKKAYIWDYNTSPFYDSGNYSKAQERLCWYMYEDVHNGFYYETKVGLCVLDTDNMTLYALSDEAAKSDISFDIKSRQECFNAPLSRKYVTDIELMISSAEDTQATLMLYSDGECYFEKLLEAGSGKPTHMRLSLVKKALYRFSFRLCGKGMVKINNVKLKYKII